jgi:hypothetical protein
MLRTFFFSSLLIIAFSGCKKQITTKKLSGTTWKRVSMITSGGQEIWYYPARQKCELDDVEVFQDGGIYKRLDIGEVCSPPGNSNGSWEVREGRLLINGGQYEVDKFSSNELILHNTSYSRISFARQ